MNKRNKEYWNSNLKIVSVLLVIWFLVSFGFGILFSDLLDQIKGHVHELGLKGKVRVNKAGCLDACAQGPTMVVYPDSIWYAPRTRQDMEEILTQHVQNDQPVPVSYTHLTLPTNA